jgi:hypothetical protein
MATTAALVLATATVVAPAPAPASARAAAAAAPYCGITWGSLPKDGGEMRNVVLTSTRTGQHPCWDRVVFDLFGLTDGFRAEYAPEVSTEGEGRPLSPITKGGALLKFVLKSPAYDDGGNATYPHRPGDHVANVAGYRTLRDVVYGGSFEGQTTFAIGVRARLPFRVFVLGSDTGGVRIVLDIAHRW